MGCGKSNLNTIIVPDTNIIKSVVENCDLLTYCIECDRLTFTKKIVHCTICNICHDIKKYINCNICNLCLDPYCNYDTIKHRKKHKNLV